MGYAARRSALDAEAFLAWEAGQALRHELVDGEVYAVAGAEERHVTLGMNIGFALRQALGGIPCRTFLTDMKLRPLGADGLFVLHAFEPGEEVVLASIGVTRSCRSRGMPCRRSDARSPIRRPWACRSATRATPVRVRKRPVPG